MLWRCEHFFIYKNTTEYYRSGGKSAIEPAAISNPTGGIRIVSPAGKGMLNAIKNYCFSSNPNLKSMVDSDEYTIYWDVNTNDSNEIVVLYRSYTGALIRYYIDPVSGEAYVTEQVPGIIDEEQRTEEKLNVRDYTDQ